MRNALNLLILLALPAAVFAAGQADSGKSTHALKRAEALSQQQIDSSHDVKALMALEQVYRQAGDQQRHLWTLQHLAELLPGFGPVKLRLAAAYAEAGNKPKAYDLLLKMKQLGFGYDISKDARFDKIHGTKVWDYILKNLAANRKPFGEGKVAFTLPRGDMLLESLAYDAKRKQFLVAGAREGRIYRVGDHGKLQDFISRNAKNQLTAITDIAADADRDRLWVATADTPQFKQFKPEHYGHAALVEFKLSSGDFVARYPAASGKGGHVFSRLALAPDGTVYVADTLAGAIYRLDGGTLKQVLHSPRLTGISGLTISGDGKTLYFSDPVLGLLGYDLTSGKGFPVGYNDKLLSLSGIESLNWYEGTLVMVQNRMVPERAMRLKLDDSGRSITAAMPLDVAQPAFDMPTHGTAVGKTLYFIADSQAPHYDRYGVLTDAAKLQPVKVYASNMHFAWDKPGISMSGRSNELPIATPGQARKLLSEPSGRHPSGADKKTGKSDDGSG